MFIAFSLHHTVALWLGDITKQIEMFFFFFQPFIDIQFVSFFRLRESTISTKQPLGQNIIQLFNAEIKYSI